MSTHGYTLTSTWTGNQGSGTSGYRDYTRDVRLSAEGRPDIEASADVPFRGDPVKWNPELLLLSAVSECHMLSYLHACVLRGVVVTSYVDEASAQIEVVGNGGRFTGATLHPRIEVAEESMIDDAIAAHEEAHEWCFISNSLNFEVAIEPVVTCARAEGRA